MYFSDKKTDDYVFIDFILKFTSRSCKFYNTTMS